MSRTTRRRARHTAVLITLVLAACSRSDDAHRSVRAPVFPGALAKPIDDYTGDELYALTTQLTYAGSHERDRDCRNSSGCGGPTPTKKTRVQVSAVATQDSIAASNVPEFGVIYARAINKGAEEEARYGFRTGPKLRYYLIVQRGDGGGMRWRLEELDTSEPRRHTQVGAGTFKPCGHPWKPGARADFKTCDAPERGDTVVTMGMLLQGSDRDPVWVSCAPGCCVFDS